MIFTYEFFITDNSNAHQEYVVPEVPLVCLSSRTGSTAARKFGILRLLLFASFCDVLLICMLESYFV